MKELNTKTFEIYKYSAKKRNLEFSITIEQLTQIVKGKCYYCDFEPRKYADGIRNGIDRLNSKKGYIESNVISCCSTCNMMKGKLSHDIFMDKIKTIYQEDEKYRKYSPDEKVVHIIKSGFLTNPRTILDLIKNGLLKEEDIHYDYIASFYLFESEVKTLKDSLTKLIRLLNIPIYDFYNKVDKLPNEILSEFYKDMVLSNYVNVRKLVKVLGGNYKIIDANLKPIIEFRKP